MAPSAVETSTEAPAPASHFAIREKYNKPQGKSQFKELQPIGYKKETEEEGDHASAYPHYLPTFDADIFYPPLQPFEHYDHGKDADPTFPELLADGVKAVDLTPSIGSEVSGVQLSKLTNAGRDQLSRYVAERKVVAFRDQDFADLPIEEALEFGRYFGRLHIHPTSGAPKGFPEVHIVHRAENDNGFDKIFNHKINSVAWHSDITYEEQPPATTFLYVLDRPSTGGDTLFADTVEAYNRLSEPFKQRLHGLKAVHSGIEQVQASVQKGGNMRREPTLTEHPIVRTHPVTGQKALWVNPQFTRYIVGLKDEESDYLLKFLFDHIAYGADFHARMKWEDKTVIVWDNRVTQHTALGDWKNGERRLVARITPQAERPFETPYEAPKTA